MNRIVIRSVVTAVIIILLLFLPAGRLCWVRGWIFFLWLLICMIAAGAYLWRVNREIFAARSRIQPGTKRWDRILLCFLFAAMLAILVVAGLDDGRFQWSRMSWWFVGLGYVLLTAGIVITAWAQGVNRFFEPGVRIQTERGHHVIDSGPYAIIRHPGYFAAFLLMAGIALSLGSWWALIGSGVGAVILVIRTILEERTLGAELPGYTDYTRRVRFRLLPGIW